MSKSSNAHRSPYDNFTGPNLGYVMEMYDLFKSSPELVAPDLAEMFSRFGAPVQNDGEVATTGDVVPSSNIGKVIAAFKLQQAIRTYGHLAADIYPLNDRPTDSTRIELSYYNLVERDLEEMPASLFLNLVPANVENGLDAINYLKSLYTGKIAFAGSDE